jgi:uncharacterized membrane protein YgaE (UPF0421/DUF939 family)
MVLLENSGRGTAKFTELPAQAEERVAVRWREFANGLQLAIRSAVAAAAAFAIARYLEFAHPIFSLISAVITTDLAPAQSRQLGARRLVATVIGAALGAGLGQLLPSGPWAIGVSILIAMLTCQLLRSPDGAKVAGFTCGIVVLEHNADPWVSALFRFAETALGVVVAMLVSYVPKLIRLRIDDAPAAGSRANAPIDEGFGTRTGTSTGDNERLGH